MYRVEHRDVLLGVFTDQVLADSISTFVYDKFPAEQEYTEKVEVRVSNDITAEIEIRGYEMHGYGKKWRKSRRWSPLKQTELPDNERIEQTKTARRELAKLTKGVTITLR